MKRILFSIRSKLIIFLAGEMTVVVNANIDAEGAVYIVESNGAVIRNLTRPGGAIVKLANEHFETVIGAGQ